MTVCSSTSTSKVTRTDDAPYAKIEALKAAGQPVVTIVLQTKKEDIGQEFVRWEVATAIAGAVIGIDPFDQPDVEDAKIQTRDLIEANMRIRVSWRPKHAFFRGQGIFAFFAPERDSGRRCDAAILKAHFGAAEPK